MDTKSESSQHHGVRELPRPTKALTDKKDYLAVSLPNGLTALLISDTSYPLDRLALEEEDDEDDEDGEDEDEFDDEESSSGEDECEDEEDEEMGEDQADDCDRRKPRRSTSGLKRSAAALCVGAGSFSDPVALPGLAHFVEHMVFMGSEKYPDENSFDTFVQKSGGSDNASTDCETTVFYFDTQRKHFREALDRFAQFFISPLMKLESMQREREAVDSEFEMALLSDYNRRQQIFGGLARKGHPMTKFMWGNLCSLQPDGLSESSIHEQLHGFRNRHYTAGSMTLTVQSQEELDTLKSWVVESFSAVPNNALPREEFTTEIHRDPFNTEQFRHLYKVIPVQNVYQLDLNWALPPLVDKYRIKPLHYMSWVIGHEGKGSLISHLRDKVWALSLTAGNAGDGFEFNSTYSIFTITAILTKEGFRNVDKVLEATFSYLSMFRSSPPSERIFDEIQRIERLSFDFGEEKQPSEFVETLCENMQFYPTERYLDGDDLLFEFDATVINDCVQALVPDNVNVIITSKEFKDVCDKSEKWFGTRFSESAVPEEWLSAWRSATALPEMHLPEPNIFVAQNISLKPPPESTSEFPTKLLDEAQGELFYRKDGNFNKPVAYYNFHVCSLLPMLSIRDAVCLDLMVNCIALSMVEDTYPADLAQLSFSLYSSERGFFLKISGFNDKLGVLLKVILNHITNFQITPEQFEAVRAQTKRSYYNHFLDPMKLARDARLSVIQQPSWPATEQHAIVSKVEFEEVKALARRLATERGCFLQALVQGNVTEEEAKNAYNMVKTKLDLCPLKDGVVPELRGQQLPTGEKILKMEGLNPKEGNTVVTNYYQDKPGNLKSLCLYELLVMIMEEPVFDVLRTKEQLGYQVFSVLRNTHGVLGFSITVCAQASKFSAAHVDGRVDAFLDWFLNDKLTNMSPETFKEHVTTLIKQKKATDVNLQEEVDRNWGEIVSREYLFHRHVEDIKNLESNVSKELVINLLRAILSGGNDFRKLSVQILGNSQMVQEEKKDRLGEEEEEGEIDPDGKFTMKCLVDCGKELSFVDDIDSFKKKLFIYPVIHIVQ